jgi:hypothetical protein
MRSYPPTRPRSLAEEATESMPERSMRSLTSCSHRLEPPMCWPVSGGRPVKVETFWAAASRAAKMPWPWLGRS